jgi:hypothetical protein
MTEQSAEQVVVFCVDAISREDFQAVWQYVADDVAFVGVCLFYDLTISGTTVFGAVSYEVEAGKIRSLKVVFDPRPLLAGKAAQQLAWDRRTYIRQEVDKWSQ